MAFATAEPVPDKTISSIAALGSRVLSKTSSVLITPECGAQVFEDRLPYRVRQIPTVWAIPKTDAVRCI